MDIKENSAVISGGCSGLGFATASSILDNGGKVTLLDINEGNSKDLIQKFGADNVVYAKCDVQSEEQVKSAVEIAIKKFGSISFCINCAGIAPGEKTVGKNGAHSLEMFSKVIGINLVGTFNVLRLCAEQMQANNPNEHGERGVIINTASVAAFDGQIGQVAYSASKAGIAGMTLPIARDLARAGIRVCTIAPGLFHTPLFDGLNPEAIASLETQVPFPSRLGKPSEYAQLVKSIIENPMLNGETIRLDGAIRMAPR